MRRGCISLGDVKCGECGRVLPIYARYLMIEEDEAGKEADKGTTKIYCVNCAQKKGYSTVKEEKGEKSLTFFT
jgi:hypothetical protein